MKKSEFPETIEGTQVIIDELLKLVELESDKEKRRELFLLILELRDNIIRIGKEKNKPKKTNA